MRRIQLKNSWLILIWEDAITRLRTMKTLSNVLKSNWSWHGELNQRLMKSNLMSSLGYNTSILETLKKHSTTTIEL